MQSNTTKVNHLNIIFIIEQHLDDGYVKILFYKKNIWLESFIIYE